MAELNIIKKRAINEQPLTIKQIKGFIDTPPIWEQTQYGIEQFKFPIIDLSDFTTIPIPENLRLGHQIEYACKQLLEISEQYKVLVYNLPIREEKQTLGEIDFILKDVVTEQIIHVELTFKFYIINTDIVEPLHQLIGPNKRDSFFMKMEKIKNRQFTLLHSTAGIKALADKGISITGLVHQTCFKAQLFKPYTVKTLQMDPLNEKCVVGYWLRLPDFTTEAFTAYQFYIPNKRQWVLNPISTSEWTSHANTLLYIEQQLLKQNSPMVWMKRSDTEFEKFFMVWW
tara:strand:- start:14688 stop:15542 length:855 start_codon:yes stop_codon:yes gene_type:complete